MKVTMITPKDLGDFSGLLEPDEAFGIVDGTLTCFAALTDEGKAAGILSVEILHDFIRLKRIFVLPKYRRQKYGSNLIEIIKERPEDAMLPINVSLEEDRETGAFLLSAGFTEQPCSYSFVLGLLGNMAKLSADKYRTGFKLATIDQLKEGLLASYIQKHPHEELTWFQDGFINMERFSESSIVCLRNKAIEAVVLMEDFEDHTLLSWMHGNDQKALYLALSMVRGVLETEYGKDYRIKCLCAGENAQKAYSRLFSEYEIKRIQMFSYE